MERLKKYLGTKEFYRMVLSLSVPIMIQNAITNFVNLLDNVMVGQLGTEAASGVSIVNQFTFIFNLLIFGAVSAAGIFTSQYHGIRDNEGIRSTFRFKMLINLASGIIGTLVFVFFGEELINLFLIGATDVGNKELTLALGKEYLAIMVIGLIPYAISQVYASTMRETEETVAPMVVGIIVVFVNLILNFVLIFGLLGAPALGVKGAAIATVISRFAELLCLVIYAHKNTEKHPYLIGAYSSFKVPRKLSALIAIKGFPLMLNEFFWALAMTMRNQCYSVRGLDVVAAINISSTMFNLFNVVYISLGSAIAIIIGRMLGAGEIDEARSAEKKLAAFTVFSGICVALLMILASLFFPGFYRTSEEVRSLASYMMLVSAFNMPFSAYANSAYFTLRSGGKVFITILFDSVYMWAIVLPVCISLAYFTSINILWLFAFGQCTEIFKVFFGVFLIKRESWLTTLVAKGETE